MSQPGGGLTASELAAVLADLQPLLPARLIDIAPICAPPGHEDLLLVLQPLGADSARVHLLIAPGGQRARLVPTSRRYRRDELHDGPLRDLLRKQLADSECQAITGAPGERRALLQFRGPGGDRQLVVELFGARGLWALLDAAGCILWLSRKVATAVRSLAPGERYQPPPAAATPPTAGPATAAAARFAPPLLAAIDSYFQQLDATLAVDAELQLLRTAAQRALQRTEQQLAGLTKELAAAKDADQLRQRADLLLAYAHTVPRGATVLHYPDPDSGEVRELPLDPARPVVQQAQSMYERARRRQAGAAFAAERQTAAIQQRDQLQTLLSRLASLPAAPDRAAENLAAVAEQLRLLGVPLRRPGSSATSSHQAKPAGQAKGKREAAAAEFRRFVSAEGYPLLVGRNNEENDRLSMRVARGNDLWLHVGGGRAGAHVIVRLPKQKTASLETLLDAATLAVHFSKARGEARIEVRYTQKKHLRKPKGAPAGAVVPAQTKTIVVQQDADRLRRLLDSASGGAVGD